MAPSQPNILVLGSWGVLGIRCAPFASKRHGRSSSMRVGPASSSSSGVRSLVPPPVRGPVARSPPLPPLASRSTTSTAGGWVACLVVIFFPHATHRTTKCYNTTPVAACSATCSASRWLAHLLVVFFFCLSGSQTGGSRVAAGSTTATLRQPKVHFQAPILTDLACRWYTFFRSLLQQLRGLGLRAPPSSLPSPHPCSVYNQPLTAHCG